MAERRFVRNPRTPPRTRTLHEGGVPISDLAAACLRSLGLEAQTWLSRIEAAWPTIVGPAIATHTRPGRYLNGELVVFVDSSVWLSEIQRYARKELLTNLQQHLGRDRFKSVQLQIDPDGPRRPPAP